MSQLGPLPVQVRIDADSLADAIKAYPEAIKAAVEEIFDVRVKRVTTWYTRGKIRRRGRIEGRTPDRKPYSGQC